MIYRIVFIFILTAFIKTSWSDDNVSVVDAQTWKDNSSEVMQNLFDQEEHERLSEYKNAQNNLTDNKRRKRIPENQYWLVNKKQYLWIGVFKGEHAKDQDNKSISTSNDALLSEKVIRIKKGNRISQFELNESVNCFNRHDGILFDAQDYFTFYTGCGYANKSNEDKLEIFYRMFFYSKEYNTILQLDEFPDSSLQGENINVFSKSVEKVKDYYIDSAIESAFKFVAQDQIIVVDDKTGKSQPKVPKTDDNGNPVIVNGKQVMIDDPDGFQASFLKRLPEVIISN